jgi:hypothetical protein
MKELYFIKIQNTATGQTRSRDILLTEKQADAFRLKVGKVERGYKLVCFEPSVNE